MASRVKFDQGTVTSRDRADLANGEAVGMTGWYYRPGDDRMWKLYGRSEFGDTGSGAKVKGLALCKFDAGGTDRLIAYSGTTYYSATPGQSGTFSALQTGRHASGSQLTSVHYNDRWYLGNGYDTNTVVEADGTTREMIQAPVGAPVLTFATGSTEIRRPTAASGSGPVAFPNFAYNTDTTDYAVFAPSSDSTEAVYTFSGFATLAEASRQLSITYATAITAAYGTILIEWYNGSAWATVYSNSSLLGGLVDKTTATISVADGLDMTAVQVRVTMTWVSGPPSSQWVGKIYDIVASGGGVLSAFTITDGCYYAITEYDSERDLESPPLLIEKAAVGNGNKTTITLPTAAQNSFADYWRIYRTTDGGTSPQDCRLIDATPIASTTWRDQFTTDKDTPGGITLNLLKTQADTDQDALYTIANQPAPALVHMNVYGPFVVGLGTQFQRSLYYSLPGYPEYWPAIYVVDSFPLAERDELVTTAVVGDTLMVGALEAMFAIDGLPEATGGLYQSANVRVLKGQPGCVGRYAMTPFSVAGEPRAAWVSPFGVHITNGQTAQRISDDRDWNATVNVQTLSTCVLHWDRSLSALVLCLDNGTYWYIHMGPEHQKPNGQPKWTGPHYGKISCMASGMVSNVYRVWSGHTTDGSVYLEMDTATGQDASQAYSSTTLPAIYTSGRSYEDHDNTEIDWLNLRHTDWGTGETCTLLWRTGTDYARTATTTTKSVFLDDHRGTEVYIGRAGEWHEFVLTHTGTGRGGILDMRIKGSVTDETGDT